MTHAYLIMAHSEFPLLEKLLAMLDHPDNHIFLHIDRKADLADPSALLRPLQHARAELVPRLNVSWGGGSMVKAELLLLAHATRTHHDYYHLLSGADLPIKAHDQINAFFLRNRGKEFLSFDKAAQETGSHLDRVRYYYLRSGLLPQRAAQFLSGNLVRLQRRLGIDRLGGKKPLPSVQKGSQWFSITHEFACFVLARMKDPTYRRLFFASHCPDELFIQTILYNSPFRDAAAAPMRYIDWSRHGRSPETLTMADWDKLEQSDCLFARKFSRLADPSLPEKVYARWGKSE